MATVKRTTKRQVKPTAVEAKKTLAQRMEEEAVDPQVHPENMDFSPVSTHPNHDYIEQGSSEHATLLGFDPDTGEIMFDTSGSKPEEAERFVAQRQRWLEAKVTPPGPEVPPMWSPDSNPNVSEVKR